MEIKVRLLQEEELHKYRKDLIQCIEDSLSVNKPDWNSQIEGSNVYRKMIGYYYMGKATIIGAFEDKRLIGYAQFFKKENGRVHLNEIAVREDYQGKGAGALLLQEVENNAKEWGATIMDLFCVEGNFSAKEFYRKHKYLTEKRLLVKHL